jgi:hypothetical protein
MSDNERKTLNHQVALAYVIGLITGAYVASFIIFWNLST